MLSHKGFGWMRECAYFRVNGAPQTHNLKTKHFRNVEFKHPSSRCAKVKKKKVDGENVQTFCFKINPEIKITWLHQTYANIGCR